MPALVMISASACASFASPGQRVLNMQAYRLSLAKGITLYHDKWF